MLRTEIDKYQRRAIKVGVITISLIAVYLGFKFLFAYFTPFIIALIISLILEPLIRLFQKLKLKRGISTLLSMLIFFGAFATVSAFAVTRIIFELSKLYNNIPMYYEELTIYADQLIKNAKTLYLQMPPEALDISQNLIKSILDKLTLLLGQPTTSLFNTIKSLPSAALMIIVTLISTFFLTKDKYIIKDFILRQFSKEWNEKIISLKNNLFVALIGFLKAQAILLTITFTESFIGLSILGIDYALLIAIIIAFVDILPVLGTGTVYVPWAIFNAIQGHYRLAISLIVIYAIIIVVRYMIEPKIVGAQLGIHPLVALISMFVGLQIMGVIGVILGPTLVVTLKACQHAGIIPKFK